MSEKRKNPSGRNEELPKSENDVTPGTANSVLSQIIRGGLIAAGSGVTGLGVNRAVNYVTEYRKHRNAARIAKEEAELREYQRQAEALNSEALGPQRRVMNLAAVEAFKAFSFTLEDLNARVTNSDSESSPQRINLAVSQLLETSLIVRQDPKDTGPLSIDTVFVAAPAINMVGLHPDRATLYPDFDAAMNSPDN